MGAYGTLHVARSAPRCLQYVLCTDRVSKHIRLRARTHKYPCARAYECVCGRACDRVCMHECAHLPRHGAIPSAHIRAIDVRVMQEDLTSARKYNAVPCGITASARLDTGHPHSRRASYPTRRRIENAQRAAARTKVPQQHTTHGPIMPFWPHTSATRVRTRLV